MTSRLMLSTGEPCGKPTRSWGGQPGGECRLPAGHEAGASKRAKHHSVVVFTCDGCGATRAGYPNVWDPDGDAGGPLGFCFLCTLPARWEQ